MRQEFNSVCWKFKEIILPNKALNSLLCRSTVSVISCNAASPVLKVPLNSVTTDFGNIFSKTNYSRENKNFPNPNRHVEKIPKMENESENTSFL